MKRYREYLYKKNGYDIGCKSYHEWIRKYSKLFREWWEEEGKWRKKRKE